MKQDNPETGIKVWTHNKDGEVVEYTPELELKTEKSLSKTIKGTEHHNLLNMDETEVAAVLKKQKAAIKAITDSMVEGRHYMTIPNVEGKYITQEGSDLLLRASGTKVLYELVDKTIIVDQNFIDYEYKAIAYHGDIKLGEAIASYNSKEDRMRKHYESFDKKTNTWSPKPNKSVFDIKNTIQQNAQKRAKNRLVRNIFAVSGSLFASEDEIKNPVADKYTQMSVYSLLYKWHLDKAPEAPKKHKRKNGTWEHHTDKQKLELRKEWVRVKIFQPWLLQQGLPTFNFGVEDVKLIKEAIPTIGKEQ